MKTDRDDARRLCAELHEDDGQPMHERERGHSTHRGSRRRRRFRKRAQLCAQVERATIETMAAELEDLELLDLVVLSVEPNPDTDHLRVIVYPGGLEGSAEARHLGEMQRRLDALAPMLRAQIARSIHRKRMPWLSFLVIPRP